MQTNYEIEKLTKDILNYQYNIVDIDCEFDGKEVFVKFEYNYEWIKELKRKNKMKVQVSEYYTEEYGFNRQTSLVIKIDNKQVFSVNELCECPEDATFGRELSDCNNIPELLRKAYEAGRTGDTFEVEYIEEDE